MTARPAIPAPEIDAASAPSVSVLMATYADESASNLRDSLESIYAQNVRPWEIILVIDGPIGVDQEAVIAHYLSDPRIEALSIVRLPTCSGLANALNAGLERCRGTYTMRMDSDDVCEPDRLERQIAYARSHPDIDLIASWSEEFFDDGTPSRLKIAPVSHDAVVRALQWRNIIIHPSTLIRTDSLRKVDGYRAAYGKLEDYDLFVRFALGGMKFHVIPKVLVRVRTGSHLWQRRGGLRYCLDEIRFRAECFRAGFLNARQFIAITAMYILFRLISGPLRGRLYALART